MNSELLILIIIFFVGTLVLRNYFREHFEIDRTNPEVIKKVLNQDDYTNRLDKGDYTNRLDKGDYEVEKKRISYTYLTEPRNSRRYFLDENRYNYVEDIPFSPHIILKSYDDLDVSSRLNISNKLDNIDELSKIEEEKYGEKADYCFRHKHKKECILSERNYKCFGKLEFTEKECEADTDLIGNRVTPGVWDRRCVNNEDCPFYKANKNYPNEFGGCKNDGYCEFPKGIKRLSYRKYNKSSIPICYNCKDENDKITINKCCHLQKDPDYLFANDLPTRYKNKKKLEQKGLYTITHDDYKKEFTELETKLNVK